MTELKSKILPVLVWPDEQLHRKCVEFHLYEFNEQLQQLSLDMFATMLHNRGVGLAAPQVGIAKRAVAICIDENAPFFFVNPKIIESSDETFGWEEGCLSVPGYFEKRNRPKHIIITYQDITGKEREEKFNDLYAFAIQHEIDHLDGKLFIDDLSSFKLKRVKGKIQKFFRRNK